MVTMHTIGMNEIPKDAEIKNDMIEEIKIRRDLGFILSPTVYMKSGRQPFLSGYNSTHNIGFMLLALAGLLDVNRDGDCDDILAAFKNTPCRIASNGHAGDNIAETTWIGHFMFDRWMRAIDIIKMEPDK